MNLEEAQQQAAQMNATLPPGCMCAYVVAQTGAGSYTVRLDADPGCRYHGGRGY